jgi:hypothetical protein
VRYEGHACPLAALGHRQGKKWKLAVKFGLLTDERGCPVRVTVYPGNTSDADTFLGEVRRGRLEDGSDVHSVHTLLAELSTIVRNTCRRRDAGPNKPTFPMHTIPNPKQHRALELLKAIPRSQ